MARRLWVWSIKWRNFLAKRFPVDYKNYLRTAKWRRKAEACYRRFDYSCALCDRTFDLHAHHRTYDRLGYEDPLDLTCLCARCHKWYHARKKKKQ